MKKLITGGVIVLLLGGYALWSASRSQIPAAVADDAQTSTIGDNDADSAADSGSDSSTQSTSSGADSGTSAQSSVSSGQTQGTYKDGTYMGSIGSAAPFGEVQLSATISGGKLTSIQMLKVPHAPGHTDEVTAAAFPILVKEAITAQSANVDIVSGATQDSEGFRQSLSSALLQTNS